LTNAATLSVHVICKIHCFSTITNTLFILLTVSTLLKKKQGV